MTKAAHVDNYRCPQVHHYHRGKKVILFFILIATSGLFFGNSYKSLHDYHVISTSGKIYEPLLSSSANSSSSSTATAGAAVDSAAFASVVSTESCTKTDLLRPLPYIGKLPTNYTPYYKYWNSTTHSIDFPRAAVPISAATTSTQQESSLEILERIIHQSEEQNLEMEKSCFQPNLTRTYELLAKYKNKCSHNKSFSFYQTGIAKYTRGDTASMGGPSYPILNMGFPKSGTSSLSDFFDCAGYPQGSVSGHSQLGRCMHQMVEENVSPLDKKCMKSRINENQMDRSVDGCYFPQMTLLDEIHYSEPNATFILLFRPVQDWIKSAANWHGMTKRWYKCRTGLPSLTKFSKKPDGSSVSNTDFTSDELTMWWCRHMTHIRNFVQQHPSHDLIELDI